MRQAKYKVGDRVRVVLEKCTGWPDLIPIVKDALIKGRKDCIYRIIEVIDNNLDNHAPIYRLEFNTMASAYWLSEDWFSIEPPDPLWKEKELIAKINTLYERQQWVTAGKPQAQCYTKPPVQSAESKAEIDPEIISPSTPMVTPTVSGVDMARLLNGITSYQMTEHQINEYFEQLLGQLPSQVNRMIGSGPTLPYPRF